MKTIKFTLPGIPLPQKRPRTFMRGRRVITWDPNTKQKTEIKRQLTKQIRERFDSENKEIQMEASNLAYGDAYYVTLTFYLPIPKTFSLAQKNAILWGLQEHTVKPDGSNLLKLYEDCANEILYPDDAKIPKIIVQKEYAKDGNPRTEIAVMPKKRIKPKNEDILLLMSPEEWLEMSADFESLKFNAPFILYEHNKNDPCVFEDFVQAITNFAVKYASILKKIEKKATSKEAG